jgi:hypothetical protein
MMNGPGYWMAETSGKLRPAITAYLDGAALDAAQIATIRGYLRQWINAPVWQGPEVAALRRRAPELDSRATIERWIADATDAGMDPL